MMDILKKIVEHKIIEIKERESLYPVKLLEKSIFFRTEPVSLSNYILREDKSGIIAEFKSRSPSKGIINQFADVGEVTIGYMQAGASALSVLTDTNFFGGSHENLKTARKLNYCPILQKDFILNEYQIIEAKSYGADAILLIASILDRRKVTELAGVAAELGLEVVLEIHSEDELEMICDNISIVGINNRDLKSFTTNISTSVRLAEKVPEGLVKISESGIEKAEDIITLRESGFNGFLIGEMFMKSSDPAAKCAQLIAEIRRLDTEKQVR